jgi:hypothetical protein
MYPMCKVNLLNLPSYRGTINLIHYRAEFQNNTTVYYFKAEAECPHASAQALKSTTLSLLTIISSFCLKPFINNLRRLLK